MRNRRLAEPAGAADAALLALLGALRGRGYRFVSPTPASHARVVARPERARARSIADVFGWSLPFGPGVLDEELERLAARGGILEEVDGLKRSRLRVSMLRGRLFLHSAYPTDDRDAVFFGPDSYRFADLIAAELGDCAAGVRIVDIGTGAGVGAIVAAGLCPRSALTMTDVNPQALRLARLNAAHGRVEAAFVETDGLTGIAAGIDVALANPPYIADAAGRAYRDGGDMHGARLSLDMATAAASAM